MRFHCVVALFISAFFARRTLDRDREEELLKERRDDDKEGADEEANGRTAAGCVQKELHHFCCAPKSRLGSEREVASARLSGKRAGQLRL